MLTVCFMNFSHALLFMCFLRLEAIVNFFPQTSQLYGYFFMCEFACFWYFAFFQNDFPHIRQTIILLSFFVSEFSTKRTRQPCFYSSSLISYWGPQNDGWFSCWKLDQDCSCSSPSFSCSGSRISSISKSNVPYRKNLVLSALSASISYLICCSKFSRFILKLVDY